MRLPLNVFIERNRGNFHADINVYWQVKICLFQNIGIFTILIGFYLFDARFFTQLNLVTCC